MVSTKPYIQLVIGDPRAHSSPVGKDEGHGALAEAHQIASLRLGLQQPLSFPAQLERSGSSDSCDLIAVSGSPNLNFTQSRYITTRWR